MTQELIKAVLLGAAAMMSGHETQSQAGHTDTMKQAIRTRHRAGIKENYEMLKQLMNEIE